MLHSKVGSSDFVILRNLVSLKALMRAYSARPSCSGCGSKVPIQPRSRGERPGRVGRVFQVTKRGLDNLSDLRYYSSYRKRYGHYFSSANVGAIGCAEGTRAQYSVSKA
jgi:hypothetical protein